MSEVRLRVEVDVNPTEDPARVRYAVENIFGKLKLEEKPLHRGSLLIGCARGMESMTEFGNLLRRERIRDAARAVLFRGLKENTVSFCLNKQVAFAGHVSFCEPIAESPLGPIRVEIEGKNLTELINWIAPRTA